MERLLGLELSAGDLAGRECWGDLKYVGVVLLPPAYLAFVLQCGGHTRWPRWVGPALALEPWPCCSCWPPPPPTTWSASAPGRRSPPPWRPRRAAVLAPPDLQHRPRLGGDGAAGGDPEPDVGLYRRQSAVLVGHPPADPAQPLVQLEGRAVPAGRPDPVRLRADHGGPGLGVYQFSLLDLRPVARSQIFRTISDLGPGARPRRPGAGRQPGGRPAGRPAAGRGRRPARLRAPAVLEHDRDRRHGRRVDQASEEVDRDGRIYDLAISALPDHQRQPGGHLVVARTSPSGARSRSGCAPPQPRARGHRPAGSPLDASEAAAEHLRTLDELKSGFLQPSPTTCGPRWPRCSASPHPPAGTGPAGRGRHRRPPSAGSSPTPASWTASSPACSTSTSWTGASSSCGASGRPGPAGRRRGLRGPTTLLDTHPVSLELLPVQVLADAAKVERIVENLLANAARHTDPGTPIWVRVSQRDRGRCCASTTPAPASRPSSGSRSSGRSSAAPAAPPGPPGRGRAGPGRPDRQPPRRPGLGRGPRRGGASFRVLLPGANGRG